MSSNLAKKAGKPSDHKKTSDQLKKKSILKNKILVLLKNVKVMKEKERLRSYHGWIGRRPQRYDSSLQCVILDRKDTLMGKLMKFK